MKKLILEGGCVMWVESNFVGRSGNLRADEILYKAL